MIVVDEDFCFTISIIRHSLIDKMIKHELSSDDKPSSSAGTLMHFYCLLDLSALLSLTIMTIATFYR